MKKLSIICLIIYILLCTAGCSSSVLEVEGSETSEENILSYIDAAILSQNNIESYEYEGDIIYIPVSYQHIDDNSGYGLLIIEYVNLNTGVMYIYTEKYAGQYSTTWCELRNSDGTPVVYENLDKLRIKHNWGLD